MRAKKLIDPAALKKCVGYNPKTGQIYLLVPTKRLPVGHVFSARYENSYIRCRIANNLYFAHRVAWVLMTGEQPNEVDHINGLRHDNRWGNLRSVTRSENARNSPKNRRKAKEQSRCQ